MQRFTILHTNDMHSAFIGMGPSSDYTEFTLNDDNTRGGYARLATLITKLKQTHSSQGPVLILDAGDYSMGTAFAAATRETGGELQLMGKMGYDATTFGNHDFDLGPEGLARSISVARAAGPIPMLVASNTECSADHPTLQDLRALAADGVICRHHVIERGGLRFGLIGLLGKEAQFYTSGAGAVTFSDVIESARQQVQLLRETQNVDIVIALSHGGLEKGADGRFSEGDDVKLAREVPGIDIVIGGHSHTVLHEPVMVNGTIPVVQTGLEGRKLGELVLALDGAKLTVESYRLHAVDDSVMGDRGISEAIATLKQGVTAAVFASRGYAIDQKLAVLQQDLPNTFTDIAAGTALANLVTDSFRAATNAHIGFTVNGMMRASLLRGKSGVQTVYDVFAVAPLGAGILDSTAGSALVTGWYTGLELKSLLEFLLVENPAHPGEYFPRCSGMRFYYDKTRPVFDVVTAVELGDLDRGYQAIDISGTDGSLYSLTSPLMLALITVGIPAYTKGKLPFVPKNRLGQPLKTRAEALETIPARHTAQLVAPRGAVDHGSVAVGAATDKTGEIKEWQAIMDYLRQFPVDEKNGLPTVAAGGRLNEVRAIKAI